MVINYEEYFEQVGLVDIQTAIPDVVVDLKYATADNFMGEILYPDLRKAYLLPHMISRLARVHARLQELKLGYRLVIYDAARPLSIQRRMFERVRGTPQEQYVANPYNEGGFHNYGMAVDLSILGSDGVALDMGSPYDFFGEEAHTVDDDFCMQSCENKSFIRFLMNGGIINIMYRSRIRNDLKYWIFDDVQTSIFMPRR